MNKTFGVTKYPFHLFLTLIGGGAFGNNQDWIYDAIKKSIIKFQKTPLDVYIKTYLVGLARDPKSPSRSSFKHMVYGLRYYYRLNGENKKAIALPSLKGDTKLPIILNQKEIKLQLEQQKNDFEELIDLKIKEENSIESLPKLCPFCKKGTILLLKKIPKIRSPPAHLPTLLLSYLY